MVEASRSSDLEIIAAAASAQRPAPETVVMALLQVEKNTKQQRIIYPPEALLGQWQLRFTTGVRKVQRGGITLGRGFYLPSFVQAQIGFERSATDADQNQFTISNQLQLGGLRFQIFGPAKYLPKKNLLAFDFTQMHLSLMGQSLYRGNFRSRQAAPTFAQAPIAKLPFFSFFLITETVIAARGRGGGLAIWRQ